MIVIPSIIPSKIEHVEADDEVVIIKEIWSEEELLDYVKEEAIKSGVSESLAIKIIKCEAPWKGLKDNRYYDINDSQSRLTYNAGQISRNPSWGNVGDREKSYGIWQYHIPAHNLTPEEASSVEISTAKAMKDLKTNPKQWMCNR